MAIVDVRIDAEDYDPRFCRNGGSYYQPTVTVRFSDGTVVVINDSSCGDFGSRIFAEAVFPDGKVQRCYYGSMLEDDLRYSDFSDAALVSEIADATGYTLPLCDHI